MNSALWLPLGLMLPVVLLISSPPSAAATKDYAVEVNATVQESPPRIDFTWILDEEAEEYRVLRKSVDDTVWTGPIATLDGSATSFSDADVQVGEAYEYSFRKSRGLILDTVAVTGGAALTFTIHDTWGDGICCDLGLGSYEVSGCGSVYASGGDFGHSESVAFTAGTPEDPCPEVVVAITLDIFGAETTWWLTEDDTADTIASGGPYSSPRFGHIFAGIRYPAPESFGTVLLLVDEPVAGPLQPELQRLELDMIREGYGVRRIDVPDETPVPSVKDIVKAECAGDPSISTLFIVGNIAVPYSGNIRGAHANHYGAWPADLYYGELDGAWTDSIVNETSASRPANHNVPGDGKFDQTYLPSDVDLQVGRLDLSRMPAFPEDEVTLLRRYLDKNHAFRRGEWTVTRRGLIDDNVGEGSGTAYACTGWRNFTAMFGPGPTRTGPWIPTLETKDYLCAYGCGAGSYTSCAGVATTADFATRTLNAVFTMLMGSYFGDWDNSDNLLRAALGCQGYPLTCCWAGKPAWHLHHMALGYPIGYSTRLTQNNHTRYMIGYGGRQVHIALMGDPTLKLHPAKPPGDLAIEVLVTGGIQLTWSPPDDSVMGYHVYCSDDIRAGFTRVNSEMVSDTTFLDTSPLPGWGNYMVRAVRLETTASGTYLNLSTGEIDSIDVSSGLRVESPEAVRLRLPNPFRAGSRISLCLIHPGRIVLKVYSATGRLVRTLDKGYMAAGDHTLEWDGKDSTGQDVQPGVYFCRMVAEGEMSNRKIVFIR